jgi:hypothetical protein
VNTFLTVLWMIFVAGCLGRIADEVAEINKKIKK